MSASSADTVTDIVRVRLDLAYDGAGFHGWAVQPGLRTVEGELTAALSTIVRSPVRLTVAGRTDTGVHAAHQVAHVDLLAEAWRRLPGRSDRDPAAALLTRLRGVLARQAHEAYRRGTGGPMPRGASDVVVLRAALAPEGFDARFSACSRRYVYRICEWDAQDYGGPDPLRRAHVLWLDQPLDVEAMARSAQLLLGEHDFLSYCKPRAGATTIRTLQQAMWRRELTGADKGLVTFTVVADAFCHSMVRSLVGAGLAVGQGRQDEQWPLRLLQARSRHDAAPVAPPHGLTLESVSYPPDAHLAAQAQRARVVRTLAGEGDAVTGDCGC